MKHRKKGKVDKTIEYTDHSSLLVFGYSSKLFRDDNKALSVERQETFIPWSGDEKLLLDRFDARVLLHSLDAYTHTSKDSSDLEEAEKIEEEMCEEERWRSLYNDDEHLETLEEETEKREGRLHHQGGEVHFNYDQHPGEEEGETLENENAVMEGPQLPPGAIQEQDEELDPYVPDETLRVPDDLTIPPNKKQYNVILKTAKFLATQGNQMEILLKTKQANNPAFLFLTNTDPLHGFYRHLVYMIKTKQYKPENIEPEENRGPSLVPYSASAGLGPKIPTVVYKPDANCAYAQLINRIKAVAPPPKNTPSRESTPASETPPGSKPGTPPPAPLTGRETPPPPGSSVTQSAVTTEEISINSSHRQVTPPVVYPPPNIPPPGAYPTPPPHALPHHPGGPPPHHLVPPPPPHMLPPPHVAGLPPHPPHLAGPGAPPPSYGYAGGPYAPPFIPPPPPGFHGPSIGPPETLAVPSEATMSREGTPPPGEEDEEGTEKKLDEAPVVFPPPEVQTIIDKMASYVARNGRTFEDVVRAKDATRFSFLFPTDIHHGYYLAKLRSHTTGNFDRELVKEPLAFKVKKTEEKETPLEKPSALPVDNEATDEENGDDKDDKDSDQEDDEPEPCGPTVKAEPKIYQKEEEKKRSVEETKIKDKLAAAAREKMIVNARERAVQLERKRKAAQFLAHLAERNTTVSSNVPIEQEENLEQQQTAAVSTPPTAVASPPRLVIPVLSSDPTKSSPSPRKLSASPTKRHSTSESEESEEERRTRKRRKRSRSRSRSRSRDRRKRKRHHRSRSRSRSSRRRSKKKKRKESSRSERSSRRHRSRSKKRSRRRKHSSSRSRSSSTSRSSSDESTIHILDSDSDTDSKKESTSKKNGVSKLEDNPTIKPAINEIKEDLRAKVRALLGSTS